MVRSPDDIRNELVQQSGAGEPAQIEVTPEMVEAGLVALWASGLVPVEDRAHGFAIKSILEAALASRNKARKAAP